MEKVLLTVRDLQDATCLSRTSIYELIRTGELEVLRIGRAVRVPRESLDKWVERKLGTKSE